MKRILITGSSGLIGSSLLPLLIDNYDVYAVERKTTATINPGIKCITCDLSGNWNTSILPPKTDCIIHLAQSEHFRDFPAKASDVFYTNTLSTLKLLDYAQKAGVKTFIYASSGGIYGNSDKGFTEDAEIVSRGDLGFYLGTKLSSEIIAENYSSIFDIIILRMFFVYGEKQKRSMLIPRLIDSVQTGAPIALNGEKGLTINPIYVQDAAKAILKAIELNGSHKINIGGTENLSLKEIGDIIGKSMDKKPNYNILDAEPKNLIGDISKMKKLLIEPSVKFKEGVKLMLQNG